MSLRINEEGTTSPAPSLETSPLISTKGATVVDQTSYSATATSTSQAVSRKKGASRSFDLDASTSPQDSVPGTPNRARDGHHSQAQQPEPEIQVVERKSKWESFRIADTVSLRLENSGSVARDHLASERTFLAYMRTSLAVASSGVALVQLFSVSNTSSSSPPNVLSDNKIRGFVRPLGAVTILIGISVLLIGVTRYFVVQSALVKGYFPAARSAIGFISLALATLVSVTFGFLVSGKVN